MLNKCPNSLNIHLYDMGNHLMELHENEQKMKENQQITHEATTIVF